MFIHYADGSSREGAILSLAGDVLRLAIAGSEDISEFCLRGGQWISEQLEVVRFTFPPGPAREEQFARAAKESLCVPATLYKDCRAVQ